MTCLIFIVFFITTVELPAVIVLGFWIAGQIMSASQGSGMQVGGGIAYWAHIGGFFAGMLMLTILGGQTRCRYRTRF